MLEALILAILAADPVKLPPISGVNQEAGIKSVHEALGDDFAKAKTPADKLALSTSLVKLANGTKDDPLARWGAFRESIRLAVEAGSPAAAVASIDSLAAHFEIDGPAEKLRAFRQLSPAAQAGAAKAAIEACRDADRADAFETAIGLAEFAASAAVRAKDTATREAAEKMRDGLKAAAKEFETAGEAKKTLDTSPDDKAASLAWGRYLALRRGNWTAGLPFLAKGSGDLATVARDDLSLPKDPSAQAALADLWWLVAESEKDPKDSESIKSRAAVWYRQALPGLSGITKAKAEKRATEIGAAASGAIKQPIELLKSMNIKKGSAVGEWKAAGKFLGIENGKFARFEFDEKVSGEYRLTLDVEALADRSTFGIYLPTNQDGRGVAVVLDTSKGSFVAANKGQVNYGDAVFAARRKTKIDCLVKKDSIEVQINDKKVMLWEGDTADVSVDPGEGWMDGKGKIAVGAHNASFLIRSVTVSPVAR